MPWQSRKWQLIGKSRWYCSTNAAIHCPVVASKHTTAPVNHTRPSPHKHSPDVTTPSEMAEPNYYLLIIYRPREDERLSGPSWLTCSRWLTHISGYPAATGRAQDREVRWLEDRHSTTIPRSSLSVLQIQCWQCPTPDVEHMAPSSPLVSSQSRTSNYSRLFNFKKTCFSKATSDQFFLPALSSQESEKMCSM